MKSLWYALVPRGIVLTAILLSAQTVFADRVSVAPYVSHQTTGNTVLFTCQGTQKVKLTVCGPRIVRVEFDPKGAFSLPTYGARPKAAGRNRKSIWRATS